MRRGVVVVGLIAALAAAVWLWWGHDSTTTRSDSQARGSDRVSFKAFDPKDPLAKLRWLGQRGVAPRRIAGTVLMDDRPVAGATVVLGSIAATAGLIVAPQIVSDASGHFDFGAQIATSYAVSADLPHRTGAIVDVDVRDPTQRTDQLELVLHPCDAELHGTIRDAGGPIARARVTRAAGDNILSGSTATADDGGSYALCVPPGMNSIVASADGYAQKSATVIAYGQLRRDFSLVPEAIVVGHVVSAADHTPVVGAVVTLRSEDWLTENDGVELTTSSDETGRFSFSNVTPGRNGLFATADHAKSLRSVHVIATLPPSSDDVICEVAAMHSVSGTVTEHKNGVGGLSVWLTKQVEHRNTSSAVTQADGSFVIESVEPGDYTASIDNHPLKPDTKVHVGTSDVEGVALEVERYGSISGRITHDGKPVEGADVSTSGARTTSDTNGHYELHDLAPKEYQIYAESRRLGSFANGRVVALEHGEAKGGVDVEIDLSGSIAGVVMDQNGAPVSGASLDFLMVHGNDRGTATTAEDGSFTANALSGGGTYSYLVQGPTGLAYSTTDGKRAHPIEVHDAHTHVTGVQIRVHVDRLSIAGRVIDANGRPVADVVVIANPQPARAAHSTDTTDVGGQFEIRDLAGGQYELQTNALGGNGTNQSVAAGRTDIVIQLVEAGRIEGTLDRLFGASSVVTASSNSGWYQATVSGSTFLVRDVPAGDYEIRATSQDAQGSAKITVVAGRMATVSVQAGGYGAIAATVIDTNGRPVPNLYCEIDAGSYRSESTDANGELNVDHVAAVVARIVCVGSALVAQATTKVNVNEIAHVTLTARSTDPEHRAKSGLVLENQLGNVALVKSVTIGGPAEHAGIAVDDIVLQVDGRPISSAYEASEHIESHPSGTVVKLLLERADKQLTVSLTLD